MKQKTLLKPIHLSVIFDYPKVIRKIKEVVRLYLVLENFEGKHKKKKKGKKVKIKK